MPAENDREFNLQRLAAENGRWAEEELRLIEAIREHKQRLAELPDIIRRLNEERERVTAEMLRTGREYDALATETFVSEADRGAEQDWAGDEADDYSDFLLTTQPPRPNPFGLFKEPQ